MIKNLGKFAHPKKQGRMPITGGKTEMTPQAASTSMNNSLQAAANIQRPPAPFKNPAGVANAPAPAVMPNGPTTKHTAGLSGTPAPAHPPKQYQIKTKNHMVGVKDNPPRKIGAMTASAKKVRHGSL